MKVTVVINYVSNNYSIMATDTRLNYNDSDHRDDIIKLRSLPYPLGFVAGVGFSTFLEHYKDFLSQGVSDVANIKIKLIEAANLTINEAPEHKQGILKSEAFVSWITKDNQRNSCVIGVMAPPPTQQVEQMNYVKENSFLVAFPSDFYSEDIKEIQERYPTSNKQLDINIALKIIVSMFCDISNKSNEVSKLCHIGVQEFEGANIRKYVAIENVIRMIENPLKHFLEIKV